MNSNETTETITPLIPSVSSVPSVPSQNLLIPPPYVGEPDGWEMIDIELIKKLEQEQIAYIKNIIHQVLHLEYLQHIADNKEINLPEIISDINVSMKYKEIHISVKKVRHTTTVDFLKSIPGKIAGIAFDHPFRLLGFLTVLSFK